MGRMRASRYRPGPVVRKRSLSHGSRKEIPHQVTRSSVSTIEIVRGLEVGDEVILSDISQFEDFDRIRLD